MTFTPLPSQGSTSWYGWATDVHSALTDSTSSAAAPLAAAFGTLESVKAHGAKGDGVTDDTAAIQAAAAVGKGLLFPPGNYVCSPNLDLPAPVIVGAGRGVVQVTLGAGSFLLDSNQIWSSLTLTGITFEGGKGAIRNRYTGTNVTGQFTVTDCEFYDYTGAAISAESSDMPLWRVERCRFRAANDTTTIGIALPGLTDSAVIRANEFDLNHVQIKLGQGGNNAYISNNGFVQFNAAVGGNHRACVWAVPTTTQVNAGAGMVATDNKYGNESLGTDDFRFLYADEGSGTYFGDRMPVLGADSTGYITNHTIRGGLLNGAGTTGNPLIYSTTPRVYGLTVTEVTLGATMPSYIFQVRTPTSIDPEASSSYVARLQASNRNFPPIPLSNQVGMFRVDDPGGLIQTGPDTRMPVTGGAVGTGFVKLLQHRVGAFTHSGTTPTQVTDSVGGTDAVTVDLSGGNLLYDYPSTGALGNTVPIWVEFDLKAGATSPLSDLYLDLKIDIVGSGGAGDFLRRWIRPTSDWRPYRFLGASGVVANNVALLFSAPGSATGANVQIGRVRMYHAWEPQPADLVLPDVTTTTTAPSAGGAGALPATPAGYMTVYVNGTPRKIAYY